MTLAGLCLLLLFAYHIIRSWANEASTELATAPAVVSAPPAAAPELPPEGSGGGDPEKVRAEWNTQFSPPYETYFLTQGLHGQTYGHLAIDIAGGKGSTIRSIINGTVTGTGFDQWGNTFLQIENDYFTVLYLHGVYTVAVNDAITAGQAIGTESNIGYTLDMRGVPCAGRDCGYHTHLNVFDKRIGSNIDPLMLIPPNYP